MELRTSIDCRKLVLQQDLRDLQELCNQTRTLELEVECDESSLSHLSLLIIKSTDEYVKFSERNRSYLQSDVEQLKENNFWLAQINDSINERGSMQQLLADTRVSKKLFQESEERRLRQSLELEEIRLSYSLSARRDNSPGASEGTVAAIQYLLDHMRCDSSVYVSASSMRAGYPSYCFNGAEGSRAYSRKPDPCDLYPSSLLIPPAAHRGTTCMDHLESSSEATAFMAHASEPLPQRDVDNNHRDDFDRHDHPPRHRYDSSSHHSYDDYPAEQTSRNGSGERGLAEWPTLSECGGGAEDMSPYSCSTLHVSSRVVTTDVSSESDM